jgi:hypothetical protein
VTTFEWRPASRSASMISRMKLDGVSRRGMSKGEDFFTCEYLRGGDNRQLRKRSIIPRSVEVSTTLLQRWQMKSIRLGVAEAPLRRSTQDQNPYRRSGWTSGWKRSCPHAQMGGGPTRRPGDLSGIPCTEYHGPGRRGSVSGGITHRIDTTNSHRMSRWQVDFR